MYEKALQANVELSQSSAQDRNESVNSRESNPSNMDYDDAILAANVVSLLFHPLFSPKTTNTIQYPKCNDYD